MLIEQFDWSERLFAINTVVLNVIICDRTKPGAINMSFLKQLSIKYPLILDGILAHDKTV